MCADDDLVAYEMSMDVEGSTAFRRKCNENELHRLSESALGMIRSCALPSFEHTLGNLLEDFTICDAGYI